MKNLIKNSRNFNTKFCWQNIESNNNSKSIEITAVTNNVTKALMELKNITAEEASKLAFNSKVDHYKKDKDINHVEPGNYISLKEGVLRISKDKPLEENNKKIETSKEKRLTIENEDIKKVLDKFDKKWKNQEWVEMLSDEEVFSPIELKRIGFLLAILSYQKIASDSSINLKQIEKVVTNFLEEENPSIENTLKLREILVILEDQLENGQTIEEQKIIEKYQLILATREKIGLALGGGGLGGIMHIGVLEVFQKAGIPVNMISGISMGALIGSIAASFIDKNGQISASGITYMENIARELKTFDDIREKRGEKIIIPLDKILGIDKDINHDLTPKVPLFIQAKREKKKTYFEDPVFFEPKTTNTVKKAASASAANKKLLDIDPVEIDGELYSDDLWTLLKSTGPGIEHLDEKGATTIIDSPISIIDFDWHPLTDLILNKIYRSDDPRKQYIKVNSIDGRGFFTGGKYGEKDATLTTTGVGELSLDWSGRKIAMNQKELDDEKDLPEDKKTKIEIPVEEYLQAGRDAAEKMLPEIFAKLGLKKLTLEFTE